MRDVSLYIVTTLLAFVIVMLIVPWICEFMIQYTVNPLDVYWDYCEWVEQVITAK